jgi:tetratricopeptide (TPR) repeat protein
MGKLAEAEELYRDALDRYRHVLGDYDRQTLTAIANLSGLLLKQDRAAEAVALLAPALPAMRQAFTGGNSIRLGQLLALLGRCRIATLDFAAAEPNLQEADAILQEAENASEQNRAEVLTGLIELYDCWDAAESDKCHRAKAADCRRRLGEALTCHQQ